MNYVGIDYHKKYSHVTAIDEEGRVIRSKRLENKPEPFQEFFKKLEGPSETVLEASRTWGIMYDLLEELEGVESVELAHSQKVRAIAEAKIKIDKIDSHILAQLLRPDLRPAFLLETQGEPCPLRLRPYPAHAEGPHPDEPSSAQGTLKRYRGDRHEHHPGNYIRGTRPRKARSYPSEYPSGPKPSLHARPSSPPRTLRGDSVEWAYL